MNETALPARSFGASLRGITQSDVSHAADSLLRSGERPTIEKIRAKIGRGSPNTINPMLDAWWKTLSARLDSGPAALHRLPETVLHIAEALWMQALEEGKRRAVVEQRDSARVAELDKQRLEVRSHVLTLREAELDTRLRDRERAIEELNLRMREVATAHRKEHATSELLSRQIAALQTVRVPTPKPKRAQRDRRPTQKRKLTKQATLKRPKIQKRR